MKLPPAWYLRTALGLLAAWVAAVFFYLGPRANAAYGTPAEGHILPSAAILLGGVAAIFWLLSYLFDIPPNEEGDQHHDID